MIGQRQLQPIPLYVDRINICMDRTLFKYLQTLTIRVLLSKDLKEYNINDLVSRNWVYGEINNALLQSKVGMLNAVDIKFYCDDENNTEDHLRNDYLIVEFFLRDQSGYCRFDALVDLRKNKIYHYINGNYFLL